MVDFFNNLFEGGHNVFINAEPNESRRKTLEFLQRNLSSTTHLVLDEFHIQVIARTIEKCIHEPFGKVKDVAAGPGGFMGAKCLVDEYKKDPMVHCLLKKRSKEDCARDIPGWLLDRYNRRVQNAIEGPNEKTKM